MGLLIPVLKVFSLTLCLSPPRTRTQPAKTPRQISLQKTPRFQHQMSSSAPKGSSENAEKALHRAATSVRKWLSTAMAEDGVKKPTRVRTVESKGEEDGVDRNALLEIGLLRALGNASVASPFGVLVRKLTNISANLSAISFEVEPLELTLADLRVSGNLPRRIVYAIIYQIILATRFVRTEGAERVPWLNLFPEQIGIDSKGYVKLDDILGFWNPSTSSSLYLPLPAKAPEAWRIAAYLHFLLSGSQLDQTRDGKLVPTSSTLETSEKDLLAKLLAISDNSPSFEGIINHRLFAF